MRSTAFVALLSGAILSACASRPTPPPAVSVALPPAPPRVAAVVPPSPPPTEIALPKDAAALGSVDLVRLDNRGLDSALVVPLRALSELADVDLADYPGLLRNLGVDIRRPLGFAVGGVSDEQRHTIDALRALVGAGPVSTAGAPAGIFAKLRDGMAPVATSLALRLLVPTLDAPRLKASIGRAFAHGWRAEGPGEYSRDRGRVYVSVSGDGDTLVVDVALGRDAKSGIAALRAQVAAGHAAPVALDGRLSAVHFTPSAAASLGFLRGLTLTTEALSGDAVDPDQKDRIAAEGLWEAGETFVLAGNDKGPFFDTVDVGVTLDGGHLGLLARAVPGPGFVGPPDAMWAPSASVAPAKEGAVIDLSQPFARAWPLPGDRPGGLAASTFPDMVKDAGSGSWPVVLGDLAPAASRAFLKDLARGFPSADSLDRFERIGAAFLGTRDMAYGVLPAKTPRAAAECVLGPARCAADVRLTLGKTKELRVDGRLALFRLIAVDKRFVVLMGTDTEMLETKFVTAPAVAPAGFDVSGEPLARVLDQLGLRATRVTGSIERRGADIVMQVVTR